MESQTTPVVSRKSPCIPPGGHLCPLPHGVGSQEVGEYSTYLPSRHCVHRGGLGALGPQSIPLEVGNDQVPWPSPSSAERVRNSSGGGGKRSGGDLPGP